MPIFVTTTTVTPEPAKPLIAQPRRFTPSFGLTLVGADGSTWDLLNGPVRILPGSRFAGVAIDHRWRTSPVIDGSRHAGLRTPSTDVILPVAVMADDAETWQAVDRALFQALTPEADCSLIVTSPKAEVRTRTIRFVAGGDVTSNPLDQCVAQYNLEFFAAPHWRGETVRETFHTEPAPPHFPGPPFGIGSANSVESATVTNPGDLPSHARYLLIGPIGAWSVGVGASGVASDIPLAAGQGVAVDMDPARQTIVRGDVRDLGEGIYEMTNVTRANRDMTSVSFEPIPPGADVPLALNLTSPGDGSLVQVEFDAWHRRPW